MLGLERERLGEIAFEVGGALAGDPVDEIEGDVVKPGITKMVERAPDVLRPGPPLEHVEQALWKLCAPSETRVTPASRRSARELGRDRLRVRLDRHLLGGGQRLDEPTSSAGSVNVGVPPPMKTVSTSSASRPRSSSSSASSAST